MKPPYDITDAILSWVARISERIGEINAIHLSKPPTELRRKNRIQTVQASLAIEGNTLTIEQVTDIWNNKRIIAPEKDIIELKNAIEVYDKLPDFNVMYLQSLCKAHKLLMKNLIEDAGKLRTSAVGIVKGQKLAHMAPPGEMVKPLMSDLFKYLKTDNDLLLIKSCVFHYEFEFIHPFTDGNGRMGRLWQTMILKEHSQIFEFLPVENLIKKRQQDYYNVLAICDKKGSSTDFIEFMLEIIYHSLEDLLKVQNIILTKEDRIEKFRDITGFNEFTRQDYLRSFKNISTATASRDLKDAVDRGVIKKSGDKRMTRYQYIR